MATIQQTPEPALYPSECGKCDLKFGCSDCGFLGKRLRYQENWENWMLSQL